MSHSQPSREEFIFLLKKMPLHNLSATSPHVAVLAFPFATHAAPLLNVVRRLAAALPDAHFSFFSTSKSNHSIFSNSKNDLLSNIRVYDVTDGVPEGYVLVGKPQEDIELFMKAAPDGFRKGIGEAVEETGRVVSCLVSDAFSWFAAEMADEMGVPWLPFWTSGPCSLSSHAYTDLIREKIGVEGIEGGQEIETLNFIPGMSQMHISDLPEGVIFGNLNSIFARMLHQMGQKLSLAKAVFVNSFEELDPIMVNDLKFKFQNFLNIGPLSLAPPLPPSPAADEGGCISWLNKQKVGSVAYVSFGSVTVPPPHELISLAEAFEASEVPFIWSLRENLKANLPNGFLENTKSNGVLVNWAPQLDVLAHEAVGVFITHCGWNSLLESVIGEVPMICRPFFGDQRLNGRMVEDVWKVGLKVEGGVFTKSGIMNSLDSILFQERGKKMREKIKVLKGLAEKAVGPKGSSTQNFKSLVEIVSRPKEV